MEGSIAKSWWSESTGSILSGDKRPAQEPQAHHPGGGVEFKQRNTRVNTDGRSSNPMIDRAADAVDVVNDGATANGIERDVPHHDSEHAGDTSAQVGHAVRTEQSQRERLTAEQDQAF